MQRIVLIVSAVVVLASCASTDVGRSIVDPAAAGADAMRIGTYDNRAIAVAYAASRFNPVRERKVAYDEAKARGDRERVDELENWGTTHRRELHFQGFGHVPVGDLLDPVRDKVVALARARGLAAIGMELDYAAGDVELIDVTDDLVMLFDPSDTTLARARGVQSAEPVPLTVLADLPADH